MGWPDGMHAALSSVLMRRTLIGGGVVAGLVFLTLLGRFIVEHANPVIRDDPTTFTRSGIVSFEGPKGNSTRINFQSERVTMIVPSADPALMKMLMSARNAGENVDVRLFLAGAHFDTDTGVPVFRVQSWKYRDQGFGPYEPEAPWSWRVMRDEQAAMLQGIALHGNGRWQAALAKFNRSLATNVLRPAQRGVALAMRAGLYEVLASAERAELGRDYFFIRAAEDYAEAEKLRPDDYRLLTLHAQAMVRLGAIDEAMVLLDRALKESREEHFSAGILKAEVLRWKGDHARALAVLDEVGARAEEELAMLYHYHRGTTLLLLERYPEAAAAFADGLKTQSGWHWAYVGRACARHEMRDDDSALGDLRTAVEIADRAVERDGAHERAVRAELRNNITALEARKGDGLREAKVTICERFDPSFDGPPRERSKLLDAG